MVCTIYLVRYAGDQKPHNVQHCSGKTPVPDSTAIIGLYLNSPENVLPLVVHDGAVHGRCVDSTRSGNFAYFRNYFFRLTYDCKPLKRNACLF